MPVNLPARESLDNRDNKKIASNNKRQSGRMTMGVKGYKVFEEDWTCRDFRYEVGETYRHDGEISLCEAGFHFCRKAVDCFNYYDFDPCNKCAEVEATGEVIDGDDKSVTDEITIVREIPWAEMLELCNTGNGNTGLRNSGYRNSGNRNSGDRNSGNRNSGNWNSGNWNSGYFNSGYRNSGNWNSGDWNSGDFNSGYRNSGYFNSGNWNSGDRNSGNWNSGDWNSGYFNTDEPPVRIFNKTTRTPRNQIVFPDFFFWVTPCEWVNYADMSEEEKKAHPMAETTDGCLRKIDYKAAWRKAFDKAKASDNWQEEKAKMLALPNFSFMIFEEITGIGKKDIMEE